MCERKNVASVPAQVGLHGSATQRAPPAEPCRQHKPCISTITAPRAHGIDALCAPIVRRCLPEELCRRLFQQLIMAVDYCHRLGIANRDIKVRAPAVSAKADTLFFADTEPVNDAVPGTDAIP